MRTRQEFDTEYDYNCYQSFYSSIMKETHEVKVEEFSQQSDCENFSVGKGVCGGLSVAHILKQLNKNMMQGHCALIMEGAAIQRECKNNLNNFREKLSQDETLEAGQIKFTNHFLLEQNITQETIDGTLTDGRSRGAFIGFVPTWDPHSISTRKNQGGHAVSVTSQYIDGLLHCTALDSNLFLARGYGKSGCREIIKKLVKDIDAHAPDGDRVSLFGIKMK